LSAEDGLADTIRPRLDSLGADCARIFAHAEPLAISLPDDLDILDQMLGDHRPRLVVIDPIVAFLGPHTDLYRANEVRSILAPLARLAERHDCALVAVRHLNKVKAGRSIYAGQGSIDFTAAARSVLLAGSAADDPRHRALVHIKSNLSPLGPARGYALDAGAFTWTGKSSLSATDLLAAESKSEERGASDEARAFLRAALLTGPRLAKDVFAEARAEGISDRTLKRAKQKEQITTTHQGYGATGTWLWTLPPPPQRGPTPKGGHTQTWPPLEEQPPEPLLEPQPAADSTTPLLLITGAQPTALAPSGPVSPEPPTNDDEAEDEDLLA
jgi:hypothetical protein